MAQKNVSSPAGRAQGSTERLGWRDEAISKRHRLYGFDCPAVDVDFLMIEYDRGKPVALVEYKHFHALGPGYQINTSILLHPSYRALLSLANASKIPFLIAYYHPEVWSFKILPANNRACTWFRFSKRNQWIAEYDFVCTLYAIRGSRPEQAILEQLSTQILA